MRSGAENSSTSVLLRHEGVKPMNDVLKRFESKFLKTEGCWNWLAGSDKNGYGRFRFGPSKARAPRVSYLLYKGEIPDGMVVRHTCDNPACVNPDHLLIGTHADNAHDKVERERQARGLCIVGDRRSYKGEGSPNAKLTNEQVKRIRGDTRLHRVIAIDYGVCRATISHAKRGYSWASI